MYAVYEREVKEMNIATKRPRDESKHSVHDQAD